MGQYFLIIFDMACKIYAVLLKRFEKIYVFSVKFTPANFMYSYKVDIIIMLKCRDIELALNLHSVFLLVSEEGPGTSNYKYPLYLGILIDAISHCFFTISLRQKLMILI